MNYASLVKAINSATSQLQGRVAAVANQSLVLRNWMVGSWIIEFEQNGKDRAKYGTRLLEKLAADLEARSIKGMGLTTLKLCRLFVQAYPEIRQTLSDQSPIVKLLPPIRQTLSDEFKPLPIRGTLFHAVCLACRLGSARPRSRFRNNPSTLQQDILPWRTDGFSTKRRRASSGSKLCIGRKACARCQSGQILLLLGLLATYSS